MSRDRIDAFLDRHGTIALDTSVVIYAVEGNPKYFDLVNPVFRWMASASGKAVTSTITMTEALVRPYRLMDLPLVKECHALLATYPNLQWIEPTLEIAEAAARIGAAHNLRTPDAIQAATAIVSGATGLISNDPFFRRVPSLDVLLLDEML